MTTIGYTTQARPYGSYTNTTLTPLITAVTYLPFGPVSGYTWQGGQSVTRTFDKNYRLTDLVGTGLTLHFARDARGNIQAEGNTAGASPAAESYKYDPLNRLTELDNASGTVEQSYTYNPTGDRLSKTVAGTTQTYGYTAGTHQLTTVGSTTRTVDAAGNTTAMTSSTGAVIGLGYDNRNRLTTVTSSGSTIGSYQYNGLGDRVWRTITSPSAGTAATVYDPSGTGNLYGEYFATDYREYVYLAGIPVAVSTDAGKAAPAISTLYADHLGTVRAVLNSAGSTTYTWPWLNNAFGEQPMGGTSAFYTRFPGQYYDEESGLFYNHNRYYSGMDDRYIQSDPIGLAGGWNTYAYVGNNPLTNVDPLGLACPAGSKAAGQCFESSNYDPTTDAGPTVQGTPQDDQAFMAHAQSLDTSDTDENYGAITNSGEFVHLPGTGTQNENGYTGHFMVDRSNTAAICHSHPRNRHYGPTPGFGDDSPVRQGFPNYLVRDHVEGVLEMVDGQFDYRLLQGSFNSSQQAATQAQLNAYQHP